MKKKQFKARAIAFGSMFKPAQNLKVKLNNMALLLLLLSLYFCESNGDNFTMIPEGSTIEMNGKQLTLGETPCDHCNIDGAGTATSYSCGDGQTGKYMVYKGDSCDGTPEIYDIDINGECFSDFCIGYNDVMYRYEGAPCKGEVMNNATYYAPWSYLNVCFIANEVDIIIERCVDGYPLAEIWHPPNYKCQGSPWGNITYNACTPPYDNHTEALTLIVNPCSDQ